MSPTSGHWKCMSVCFLTDAENVLLHFWFSCVWHFTWMRSGISVVVGFCGFHPRWDSPFVNAYFPLFSLGTLNIFIIYFIFTVWQFQHLGDLCLFLCSPTFFFYSFFGWKLDIVYKTVKTEVKNTIYLEISILLPLGFCWIFSRC